MIESYCKKAKNITHNGKDIKQPTKILEQDSFASFLFEF
jgi:hypothetical protein